MEWSGVFALLGVLVDVHVRQKGLKSEYLELYCKSFDSTSGMLVGSWLSCIQYFPCSGSYLCLLRVIVEVWKTSILNPNMHQNRTECGNFCMQNNQLPVEWMHVESVDSSIMSGVSESHRWAPLHSASKNINWTCVWIRKNVHEITAKSL